MNYRQLSVQLVGQIGLPTTYSISMKELNGSFKVICMPGGSSKFFLKEGSLISGLCEQSCQSFLHQAQGSAATYERTMLHGHPAAGG